MFYARMILRFALVLIHSSCLFAQGLLNQQAYIIQSNGSIVTQQHFTNNGRFTQRNGTFVFVGNAMVQKLKGTVPVSFHQLHIAPGSNTLLESGGHSIKSTLKSDGLLNANNNITLLSTISRTAAVDGTGLGEISGNLTMQAYLANGYGYKYLGAPFQSATVNELAAYVNLSAAFPSVYRFEENVLSNGWVNYMAAGNLLEPMRGYAFQFGNSNLPKTIAMTGVVNNGLRSLSLNNNNKIYTKGFHLISNPYPSPIDWDEALGWTKINIDNAIYYFDTDEQSIYTGVYNTYINGISSNGLANNFIPAMQGFFIHVSDGGYPVAGTLSVNNNARLTHITQAHRELNALNDYQYLRLSVQLEGAKIADPLVIYFSANARDTFHQQFDALKLMNTSDRAPNLYSLKQAKLLSIQSLRSIQLSTQVPIGIMAKSSGAYVFKNTNITSLPAGIYCYLYDSLSKNYVDLKKNTAYKVQMNAGENNRRFSIVFSKTPINQAVGVEPNNDGNGFQVSVIRQKVYITLPDYNGQLQSVQVTNLLGQKHYYQSFTQGGKYLLDSPFPSGVYIITHWHNQTYSSKKIFIPQ